MQLEINKIVHSELYNFIGKILDSFSIILKQMLVIFNLMRRISLLKIISAVNSLRSS